MASVADQAIVPHQDLAGLGSECRMNLPAKAGGNWEFRILPWTLKEDIQRRLKELIWVYGRSPLQPSADGEYDDPDRR
jgi:4-alpha-glucanotransferase